MITKDDIAKLTPGCRVDYGHFTNVKFVKFEDPHVVLEDKNGEQRKFFMNLFLKHGTLTATKKPYQVYRQWGTRYMGECDTEHDAWEMIGNIRFGEGHVVCNEKGEVRPEFIPA